MGMQSTDLDDKDLIIYNASAGSGKTYTLSVEYVVLCLKDSRENGHFDPTHFRRILAITFTNKAANELKERILRFMADLAEWENGSTADPRLLTLVSDKTGLQRKEVTARARMVYEGMIFDYTDIHVSTIDKFVLSILRSFFKELGLSPDFDIQLDQKEMIARIRDNIIEQVGTDPLLTQQLLTFLTSKADDDKAWKVKEDLDGFLGELLKEEGQKAKALLSHQTAEEVDAFATEIDTEYRRIVNRIRVVQETGSASILRHNIPKEAFAGGELGFTSRFFQSPDKWVRNTPKQLEAMQERPWHSSKGKHLRAEIDDLRPVLLPLLLEFNDLVGQLPLLKLYRRNLVALQLYSHLDDQLELIEEEDQLTLISTNNSRIADVVRENPAPFIYERLGERFEHFLLDEFQDTSVMQWQNFLPLITDSLAKGKKSFIVGDGKQSIYRWRSGEVEQFVRLPSIYAHDGGMLHQEYEATMRRTTHKETLKKNYRSKNEVIGFNNLLFEYIKGDLDEGMRKVYEEQQQEFISSDNTGGLVVLKGYIKNELKEEETDFHTESLANVIVRVKECIADGYRASDMAMLVRSRDDGQFLAKGLTEAGFQVLSNESFFLGRNSLCQLVVAVISYLDDARRTGSRLQIIAQMVKLHDRQADFQLFAEKYAKFDRTSPLPAFFADLGIRFSPDDYQEVDLFGTAERIIRDLELDGSDVYLLELLHVCAEQSIRRSVSLREFVDFWEDGAKEDSLKLPAARDAIRILTIHKSKGLQFPVVFIPFYRGETSKVTLDYLWVDTGDERVPRMIVENKKSLEQTIHRQIRIREQQKDALDRSNMLYVSTTRAEDRIYLHFNDSPVGSQLSRFLSSLSTSQLSAFGKRSHRTSKPPSVEGIEEEIVDYQRDDWRKRLRVSMGREQAFAEQRERGIVIHDALAGVGIDPRSPFYKEAMDLKGAVWQMPGFSDWITDRYIPRHEVELLDASGHTHRPDTIFFAKDGSETIVVDYKTGARRDTHVDQVKRYVHLLDEMGEQKVTGHLLYTDALLLERVV